MGYWKLLQNLGTPEGTREAMRLTFDKHWNGTRPSHTSAHEAAVFGALSTRWRLRRKPCDEITLAPELLPFMYLGREEAKAALAEYAVLEERSQDALRRELTASIVKGLNAALKSDPDNRLIMQIAKARGVLWTQLVEF